MKFKNSLKNNILVIVLFIIVSITFEYLSEGVDIEKSWQYFLKGCIKGVVFLIFFHLTYYICEKIEKLIKKRKK